MDDIKSNHIPHPTGTKGLKDFFLARQPVLNSDQRLFAYELLFCNAKSGAVQNSYDLLTTATVIEHAAELGISHVTGDSIGFINVDDAMVLSDIIKFLPAPRFVLALSPNIDFTYEVVERIKELSAMGFMFALDHSTLKSPSAHPIQALIHFIKVDTHKIPDEKILALAEHLRPLKKKIFAHHIDTHVTYKICKEAGFDLYQGLYFAKPVILAGRKIAPSHIAVLKLMELLMSDAESSDIEHVIKQNAALGLNLLRMVNTPAAGFHHRIDSIRHALVVIGRRQLQRWLQILLYAANDKKNHLPSPLLMAATTRGKLLELMAEKLRPQNRAIADIAFTVGIMSHMDALFGVPMEELLGQFTVADEVHEALLTRSGFCGDLLTLVECLEHMEHRSDELITVLNNLHLTVEDLYSLQIVAFEWTSQISAAAN